MIPLVKLLRLSPRDRRLFLNALAVVISIRLQLWFMPLRRIIRRLDLMTPGDRWTTLTPDEVAQMVRRASRCVPRATCLTQALAAGALLHRTGRKPLIRIGVAKDADLKAHAWVECEGRVVLGGGALGEYTALGTLDRIRN